VILPFGRQKYIEPVNPKTTLYLVCILALSGCLPPAGPLDASWPISYPRNYLYNSASVEEGYILLRNKDTLWGRIKLFPLKPNFVSHMSILPKGKDSAADVINVPAADIDYIRIYRGSFYTPHFTDFVNLDGQTLWRLLARRDSVGIYDALIFKSNLYSRLPPSYYAHFEPFMILLSHGRRVKMYSLLQWDLNHRHQEKLLIKFINHYYKTSFRRSDFKSSKEIFDYILQRETENEMH
jgi:hypothetical protein